MFSSALSRPAPTCSGFCGWRSARLDDWIGQLEQLGRAGIDSGTLLDWAERVKRGEPLPQDDEPVQSTAGS